MTNISFKTLDKIAGPLIFVKGVQNASYGEMVEIKLQNGERRQGQVLDTSQGLAIVQVFGQTLGLTTSATNVIGFGETNHFHIRIRIYKRELNLVLIPQVVYYYV